MSAGSWYRQAGQERDKARKYEKWKKELEKIIPVFSNSFSGVIGRINKNVGQSAENSKDGIRKDSAITSNLDAVAGGDEFDALSDAKVSNCCSSLKAEINDLERKRQEAERKADECQARGDAELEAERQARLKIIKETLSKA